MIKPVLYALLCTLASCQFSHLSLDQLEDKFLEIPSAQHARQFLKVLTSIPHMAGTPGDKKTADYVLQKFKEFGLHSYLQPFHALVVYPSDSSLKITHPPEFAYVADLSEDVIPRDSSSSTWFRNHAFNGYSPSGNVSGELVYVNYGREVDFEHVETNLGISLEGKVALVRYGQNYRGIKVHNAQKRGMIGCILYSDPLDDGFGKGPVYPDGPWRPSSGIQRGAVDTGSYCVGDPLFVERDPNICGLTTAEILPQIPVLPISYRDAVVSVLYGEVVNEVFSASPRWIRVKFSTF
jgi:N-acetylated-alpha-linked acidic dipeptidase